MDYLNYEKAFITNAPQVDLLTQLSYLLGSWVIAISIGLAISYLIYDNYK